MSLSPSDRTHRIRPATLADVVGIVAMIRELAEFERLTHLCEVTPERLRPHLFGERPMAECLVAEAPPLAPGEDPSSRPADGLAAFALYFHNFSTFLAKPGLYLEDLYVRPSQRGTGLGKALLQSLGRVAVERGCGRFEWSVLDWNENAIRFYEGMGATVMPDWRICRVAGDRLAAFAPGKGD
jgi:GNAT superfamily N-acetyltransferase